MKGTCALIQNLYPDRYNGAQDDRNRPSLRTQGSEVPQDDHTDNSYPSFPPLLLFTAWLILFVCKGGLFTADVTLAVLGDARLLRSLSST
jgi:hypothetical protein